MQVTATQAKNRFGELCALAKKTPVFVEKSGQIDSVIVSFDDYMRTHTATAPGAPNSQPLSPNALRFYEENKDWMDRQNAMVTSHGLWCDGLVDWLFDVANPKHQQTRAELRNNLGAV